jgi:hypothetical protein
VEAVVGFSFFIGLIYIIQMPIDCNALCNNDQSTIYNLIKTNKMEEIQNEVSSHQRCMMDCERRNSDADRDATQGAHADDEEPPLPTHRARDGGGNRKKYIGKTKSSRSRTRRLVHHRRPRTRRNHPKKTARR